MLNFDSQTFFWAVYEGNFDIQHGRPAIAIVKVFSVKKTTLPSSTGQKKRLAITFGNVIAKRFFRKKQLSILRLKLSAKNFDFRAQILSDFGIKHGY